MGDVLATLARVAGRRAPRGAVPPVLLKAIAPAGRFIGPLLGFPPNLREVISSSHRVTFWARSDKAQRELGWTHRSLEDGLATLVGQK
jgi:hypothetical protein